MPGYVNSVFIKYERGKRVQEPPNKSIILKERFGILNDVNANQTNPRQVLIASRESIKYFDLQKGDLKENILTENFPTDILESGNVIQIGEAIIRITFPCEPCKYISSLGIQNLNEIMGKRGKLGVVLKGGQITEGYEISILEEKYPYIPTRFVERLSWVTDQIPFGKVVTYKQLVKLAGGASSYIRAIPGFIKRTSTLPVHRIVDSEGQLIEHVPQQDDKLESEGIINHHNKVDVTKYQWDTSDLFYLK